MMEENCYISMFNNEDLNKYGLSSSDKKTIETLIEKAKVEKLYTETTDFKHNLKHIEKVLSYTLMIVNKMNESKIDKNILLTAGLYHDIGKSIGASNIEHGEIGAKEFQQRMESSLDSKTIDIICKLIRQHASEKDEIEFDDNYTFEERESIQLMSNILKDADALDRNRLNFPAPIGTCDEKKLRTAEAKNVLKLSDEFYNDYCRTIIAYREKKSGHKILDNYELLNSWIKDYNNGSINMFHASLDPSVDILRPVESTQKGAYVYAGISPINCMTMASFRSSTIFPRTKKDGKRAIMEIFPNSINETLNSKYISIYKLPDSKFHEYIAPATSAPTREWVSEESVEPLEQVSFNALELLNYLKETKQLGLVENYSKNQQFKTYMDSFKMYIWGVKNKKSDPEIMDKKWEMAEAVISYYSKNNNVVKIMNDIKRDTDSIIEDNINEFKNKNGREPDYDNENECLLPVIKTFEKKYFIKDSNGNKMVNFDNIYNSLSEENKIAFNSLNIFSKKKDDFQLKQDKVGFDQRSEIEVEIAQQIKEKNLAIKNNKENQNMQNKPMVKQLINPNGNGNTTKGFINIILILFTILIACISIIIVINNFYS